MKIIINDTLFCRNLRYLRTKHRYSQKALAAMVGISVYTLRILESGKYQIILNSQELKRLCGVFGVPVEHMLHKELAA